MWSKMSILWGKTTFINISDAWPMMSNWEMVLWHLAKMNKREIIQLLKATLEMTNKRKTLDLKHQVLKTRMIWANKILVKTILNLSNQVKDKLKMTSAKNTWRWCKSKAWKSWWEFDHLLVWSNLILIHSKNIWFSDKKIIINNQYFYLTFYFNFYIRFS